MNGQPVASVIVPCRDAARYVGALLDDLRAAADRLARPAEILCIDDGSTDATAEILAAAARADPRVRVLSGGGRGVSAARNAGLDAASGAFVMFADADDRVDPDFLARPVAALERTGADCCRFGYRLRKGEDAPYHDWPVKGNFNYATAEEIRADYLPRILGFSFDDLRVWGAGGEVFDRHELGGVWAFAYRRAALERARVRFDEEIALYEDALFNCAFLLEARTMTHLTEPLYSYTIRDDGCSMRLNRDRTAFDNKPRLLARRKALDAAAGGTLTASYAASCVLGALEMAAALVRRTVPWREGWPVFRAYLGDETVRAAVRTCPFLVRRPLFSLALAVLRGYNILSTRKKTS